MRREGELEKKIYMAQRSHDSMRDVPFSMAESRRALTTSRDTVRGKYEICGTLSKHLRNNGLENVLVQFNKIRGNGRLTTKSEKMYNCLSLC